MQAARGLPARRLEALPLSACSGAEYPHALRPRAAGQFRRRRLRQAVRQQPHRLQAGGSQPPGGEGPHSVRWVRAQTPRLPGNQEAEVAGEAVAPAANAPLSVQQSLQNRSRSAAQRLWRCDGWATTRVLAGLEAGVGCPSAAPALQSCC